MWLEVWEMTQCSMWMLQQKVQWVLGLLELKSVTMFNVVFDKSSMWMYPCTNQFCSGTEQWEKWEFWYHKPHVKYIICDEVVECLQDAFTRNQYKSIRRTNWKFQLPCSTVHDTVHMASACIYMYTRSSIVSVSHPMIIVSTQNL
jgi:hypothetical protein